MLVIKENSRCTSEVLFYGIWRRIPNVGGHSGSVVEWILSLSTQSFMMRMRSHFSFSVKWTCLDQDYNMRLPILTHKRYLKTFETDG